MNKKILALCSLSLALTVNALPAAKNSGQKLLAELLLHDLKLNNIESFKKNLKNCRNVDMIVDSETQETLLHYAALWGRLEFIEVLLEKKASVDALDHELLTPLHRAIIENQTQCAAKLIKHGADVNLADNESGTPLHAAAFSGFIENLQLLLNSKANVNAVDKDNITPLHEAAFAGKTESIRELLAYNADITVKVNNPKLTAHGKTALEIAQREGYVEIVTLLQEAEEQQSVVVETEVSN
ncbi:ankyrin repeat domain-containing protein [bacterium]|nr:MAG: ankyrin repeat domain-containing protein [bacterium]